MEELKAEITRIADMELETAIDKWGLNHSDHESAGVLREEIDEAKDELSMIEYHFTQLWKEVKRDGEVDDKRNLYNGIFTAAINMACEAVQVAAMARKGIVSSIEIYTDDNKHNALNEAKERKRLENGRYEREQDICD